MANIKHENKNTLLWVCVCVYFCLLVFLLLHWSFLCSSLCKRMLFRIVIYDPVKCTRSSRFWWQIWLAKFCKVSLRSLLTNCRSCVIGLTFVQFYHFLTVKLLLLKSTRLQKACFKKILIYDGCCETNGFSWLVLSRYPTLFAHNMTDKSKAWNDLIF